MQNTKLVDNIYDNEQYEYVIKNTKTKYYVQIKYCQKYVHVSYRASPIWEEFVAIDFDYSIVTINMNTLANVTHVLQYVLTHSQSHM